MSAPTTMETLQEVFADVFGLDAVALTTETSAKDIENWDSVNHVMLITAVEKKFSIRFKSREIAKFNRVGDIVDAVEKQTVGK